jgi:hypothetical protein
MTTTPDYFSIILTSAVVAALISSGVLIFNEWRRRVSEERRFAVDAALQLVKMKNEELTHIVELRQKSGQSTRVYYGDPLINLIWYRKHLERLLKGQFSEVEKKFSKQLEEIEAKWNKE